MINRQRPSTASGAIFLTLEDETGRVNLVIWPWVAERQRRVVLHARPLMASGSRERDREVEHSIAGRLQDHSRMLGRLERKSRVFSEGQRSIAAVTISRHSGLRSEFMQRYRKQAWDVGKSGRREAGPIAGRARRYGRRHPMTPRRAK